MDYCRVVGPRGLCRPLDKKQGLPTNTSPLAPCEGCSKAGKERLFAFQGQDRAGQAGWRGCLLGPAQKAPGRQPGTQNLVDTSETTWKLWPGSPPRTGPGGPGSLESASLGPRRKCVFWPLLGKIGGVPRTGPGGPGSLESASLGPQNPWAYPPDPQNCRKCVFWPVFGKIGEVAPSERPRRPRVPGICQPGAPDPPGGTPQTPQKTQNDINGEGFGVLIITD